MFQNPALYLKLKSQKGCYAELLTVLFNNVATQAYTVLVKHIFFSKNKAMSLENDFGKI